MNKILPILLFICNFCYAQNYQCLQSGVKHYFTNNNGYLRGIRIDSVKTYADSTVYYPFHSERGSYDIAAFNPRSSLNPNGGSWLGSRVMQLNGGTFVFDSYWNDSVIIKTQANVGDTWTFYSDTSMLYYKATVTAIDTMTVLSAADSVKYILITAHDTSGTVATDPVDSFTIILSKNHGFVQVFDLYTFPYHKPDSVFRAGLDFILDRSTANYTNIQGSAPLMPDANVSIFKLVNFIAPNDQQLYNWNTGDIIESAHTYGTAPIVGTSTTDFILDTVYAKVTSGALINYTMGGTPYNCTHSEPCSLITNAGSYSISNGHYSIIDTSFMPEETNFANYIFYYPQDASNCLVSPKYILVPATYNSPVSLDFTWEYAIYKMGVGKTYFYHFDDEPSYETDNIVYSNINGVPCGTPLDTIPALIKTVSQNYILTLSPNPAHDVLNITCTNDIHDLEIYNMYGEAIYKQKPGKKEAQVSITNLPNGIYMMRVNGSISKRFVKE